jgi:hypothetical protein
VTSSCRPIFAGHDWPLYGDEYGIMKFGNYHKETIINFRGMANDYFQAAVQWLNSV